MSIQEPVPRVPQGEVGSPQGEVAAPQGEVLERDGERSNQPVLGDRGASGEARGASGRAAANLFPSRRMWFIDFYRSGVGKKAVMALTGIAMMGFVLAHAVGNLKLYVGAESMNFYGEWLRDVGYPALPHSGLLWILRSVLIVSLVLHVHAAWSLTRMNRRARPTKYVSERDYIAATFAARTMRWTGIIVLLFIVFHLLDLTFGPVNPGFEHGSPYENTVASFQRIPVAIFYLIANIALGVHLWHGAWSLFQSLGINNRRFNRWRQYFAWGFTLAVVGMNVSFPLAVMAGVIA